MAYTYVIKCADGSFYTGWTIDLEKRLQAHNGEIPGGAKYTKGRRPVTLYWAQYFEDKIEAQKLEHYIKTLSRKKKLEYWQAHGEGFV